MAGGTRTIFILGVAGVKVSVLAWFVLRSAALEEITPVMSPSIQTNHGVSVLAEPDVTGVSRSSPQGARRLFTSGR